MKKYTTLLLLLSIGLGACDNFLDVTPKNVISMADMVSIKKAMGGFLVNAKFEGGGINGNSLPWSPFNASEYSFANYSDAFDVTKYEMKGMTEEEVEIVGWKRWNSDLWNTYYRIIGFMNLVIVESEKAPGEADMRDYVMGEAYAWRAYSFFKLLQFYSPYKNNELGIPVCLESYEDFEKVNVKRKTQQEGYTQVISDLNAAFKCLNRTVPRESYNMLYSSDILSCLMAQIYHYKALSGAAETDDWTNAAFYAKQITDGNKLISDVNVLKDIFDCTKADVTKNTEVLIRWKPDFSSFSFDEIYNADVYLSDEFYTTYFDDESDIRKTWFYEGEPTSEMHNLKINKYNNADKYWWEGAGYVYFGFRLAETYLIQAEALAMSDDLSGAQSVFKTFKEARYTGVVTVPSDREGILKDIYRERRKEFLAENDIHWLDMKRLGMVVTRVVDGVTYKLDGFNDYRYTFPIPVDELKNNKDLTQNPGWIEK